MQPASTTSPRVPESPPRSNRGDWTWELVDSFPRQGDWTESEYLSRSFEGLVEFSDGVLEFVAPLYLQEEGGPPASKRGDWTWEMVTQFPRQGNWSVEAYLAIDSQRLIEFDRGVLEFLPMPTAGHQLILGFLYRLFSSWCSRSNQPSPLFAPIPVAVASNRYREPDLLLPGRSPRSDDQGIDSPRLVVEIVSSGSRSRQRDLVHKRADYAAAGIPECWIVDPETETITVLTLPSGAAEYAVHAVHGEFSPGDTACSKLLEGFTVDVAACFAAGKGEAV